PAKPACIAPIMGLLWTTKIPNKDGALGGNPGFSDFMAKGTVSKPTAGEAGWKDTADTGWRGRRSTETGRFGPARSPSPKGPSSGILLSERIVDMPTSSVPGESRFRTWLKERNFGKQSIGAFKT